MLKLFKIDVNKSLEFMGVYVNCEKWSKTIRNSIKFPTVDICFKSVLFE